MKIVIVEDDHMQLGLIRFAISQNLRIDDLIIVETESDFHNKIKDFEADPPNLFIIDVMLPWCIENQNISDLDQTQKKNADDAYKAGFICNELISKNKALRHIPRIIYSVVEKEDLRQYYSFNDKNVYYLLKDREYEPLTELIAEVIQ